MSFSWPRIDSLFMIGGPSTIHRPLLQNAFSTTTTGIMSIVVNAIKCQTGRAFSHSSDKGQIILTPSFAHYYSTFTPISKLFMIAIETARFCISPRSIFSVNASPHRLSVGAKKTLHHFQMKTATALCSSAGQRSSLYECPITTRTKTQPTNFAIPRIRTTFEARQSSKYLARKIKKSSSHCDNLTQWNG
jgi:hypothetical protein